MPEKSVREMTELERKHYSLAARMFHAAVMGSVILGLVALAIGLGLYTFSLANNYISTSFNLSRNAAAILEKVVDIEPLADDVMESYRALSSEEREQTGTEAYRSRFASFTSRGDYEMIRSVLGEFLSSSDVSAVYLAMYDAETSAMVYIVDPDEDPTAVLMPGEWEAVEPEGLEKFLSWDGSGMLYDIDNTEYYGWLCTSGVPLRGSDGEIAAFVLTDVSLADVRVAMKSFVLQYSLALILVIFAFGYLLVRHMKKTLVQPINAIAEAAQDYARDKRAGVHVTDHFSLLNIRTGDEVENLSLVMADMERDLSDYVDNLTRVTAEKERIGTELALATRIQADMLPNIFPAFPERDDFDIYASMNPAKEVGGDFYDFFLIDDAHLGLVMADVSGKGVPAALLMMMTKIMLQNYTMSGRSPKEILEVVNRQICRNNREEMFVTVWLGILDLCSGRLTAANAGHEYPIFRDPKGDFTVLRDKHGFVVGGMEETKYREYQLQLEPGAKLFLYTDGVTEAVSESGELFGLDRTLRALNAAAGESPKRILESVDSALKHFVGGAEQFDDITMLCVEFFGKKAMDDIWRKELTVEATIENIERVTDFVNEALDELDCPPKAQMQLDIAVDELFSNIAKFAYAPETGTVTVRVEAQDDPRAAILTFIDQGIPYDPLAYKDPDITLSAEEREIGGLGILVVKRTMDDIHYEYRDGKNILRIRKNL